MTQQLNPKQSTASILSDNQQDWLNSDISCLEAYEPYDWGETDPLTLGKPIIYDPNMGYIVEENDHND